MDNLRNARTELLDFVAALKLNPVYGYVAECSWKIKSPKAFIFERSEDFSNFLWNISAIDYDGGYGSQELEGIIVFEDNSWLSRHEYDGSECWQHNSCPSVGDVYNRFLDSNIGDR